MKRKVISEIYAMALCSCVFFCISCKSRANLPPQEATLEHNLNQPVNRSDPLFWVAVKPQEIISVYPYMRPLPENHILTQRLQAWVDILDLTIRTRYPKELAPIPKPRGIMIEGEDLLAYVINLNVGYAVPINGSRLSKPGESPLYLSLPGDDGALETVEEPELERKMSDLLARRIASQSDNPCQFSNISGSTLTLGDKCKISPEDLSRLKGINLRQIPSVILMQASILRKFKHEEEWVAIIAHELAHYYKAHSLHRFFPEIAYDFFYTIGAHGISQRPSPEPMLEEFGAQVSAASRFVDADLAKTDFERSVMSQTKVEWGFISDLLDHIRWGDFSTLCQNDECRAHCNTDDPNLKAYRSSRDWESGEFAFSESGKILLNKTVQLIRKCAASLPSLTSDQVEKRLRMIHERRTRLYVNVDWPVTDGKLNLWDQLTKLTALIGEKYEHSLSTLKEAAERGLGYYTSEQEADELAAEWLALIGIDPKYAVTAFISISTPYSIEGPALEDFRERYGYYLGIDAELCRELFNNSWKNKTNQPYFVPLGRLSDPHHSECFRAYNLSREIAAHKLIADKEFKRPKIPGGSWSEIQAQGKP